MKRKYPKKIKGIHFTDVLIYTVEHIDKFKYLLYYKDDLCTVIYDAYPKSKVHFLIMPNDTNILSLNELTKDHIPLIQHMQDIANRIIQQYVIPLQFFLMRCNSLHETKQFSGEMKMGFHAKPSLK